MAPLAAGWASKVKRRTFEQEDVEDRHADGFDSLLAQTSYVPVPWRHRNGVEGVRMGKVFAIMHKVQRDARLRMAWTLWTRAVASDKVKTAQDHIHLREGLQMRPDADSQSDQAQMTKPAAVDKGWRSTTDRLWRPDHEGDWAELLASTKAFPFSVKESHRADIAERRASSIARELEREVSFSSHRTASITTCDILEQESSLLQPAPPCLLPPCLHP